MKKVLIILVVLVNIILLSSLCFAEEFDLGEVSLNSGGMEMHGYYEFEYRDAQRSNDTFDAHKITVWIGKKISDEVYVSSEFEYEHFPRLEDAGEQRVGGSGELDSSVDGKDREVSGYYAQLGLKPVENVELAVRYDVYDNDTEKTENENTAATVGVGIDIYKHTKLKAEYQWNEEEGSEVDNNAGAVGIVVDW